MGESFEKEVLALLGTLLRQSDDNAAALGRLQTEFHDLRQLVGCRVAAAATPGAALAARVNSPAVDLTAVQPVEGEELECSAPEEVAALPEEHAAPQQHASPGEHVELPGSRREQQQQPAARPPRRLQAEILQQPQGQAAGRELEEPQQEFGEQEAGGDSEEDHWCIFDGDGASFEVLRLPRRQAKLHHRQLPAVLWLRAGMAHLAPLATVEDNAQEQQGVGPHDQPQAERQQVWPAHVLANDADCCDSMHPEDIALLLADAPEEAQRIQREMKRFLHKDRVQERRAAALCVWRRALGLEDDESEAGSEGDAQWGMQQVGNGAKPTLAQVTLLIWPCAAASVHLLITACHWTTWL